MLESVSPVRAIVRSSAAAFVATEKLEASVALILTDPLSPAAVISTPPDEFKTIASAAVDPASSVSFPAACACINAV